MSRSSKALAVVIGGLSALALAQVTVDSERSDSGPMELCLDEGLAASGTNEYGQDPDFEGLKHVLTDGMPDLNHCLAELLACLRSCPDPESQSCDACPCYDQLQQCYRDLGLLVWYPRIPVPKWAIGTRVESAIEFRNCNENLSWYMGCCGVNYPPPPLGTLATKLACEARGVDGWIVCITPWVRAVPPRPNLAGMPPTPACIF